MADLAAELRTGAMVDSTGAHYGDSRLIEYQVLAVFNSTKQDVGPARIPQPSGDAEASAPSDRSSGTQSARSEP